MPKSSRSPLYFYASEYQRQYQRTKGQRINISEAIAACYDDWKALPEEEKQVYKDQYEQWRIQSRSNPNSVPVSNQRSKINKEVKNDKILHERDIPCEELKSHYDRFSSERNFLAFKYLPLDLSELLSMPIYIINFQIFCKIDEEDGGEFIPAEMCILRYTLMEGVTVYRQKFIKSNKIPSGYMSACLEHSKETHQIPLKDFPEASDNYKQVYQELKTFLLPTIINQANDMADKDDRTRRRYLRLRQPCVFFPALEYEQTSKLIDWLQEKAEGLKATKDTRLVNLASLESLIMVLAELKHHSVSRDSIQKTFENAAYSFMIEERCPYHAEIGISHCSVARCHAGAKLISAYLNQLYVPERLTSSPKISGKQSPNVLGNKTPNRVYQSAATSRYSISNANDSIASSHHQPKQSDQITKLQQQNFHRLLSNAESIAASNNYPSEYTIEDDHSTSASSHQQRTILSERRQVLLNALQSIDKQIEELDID